MTFSAPPPRTRGCLTITNSTRPPRARGCPCVLLLPFHPANLADAWAVALALHERAPSCTLWTPTARGTLGLPPLQRVNAAPRHVADVAEQRHVGAALEEIARGVEQFHVCTLLADFDCRRPRSCRQPRIRECMSTLALVLDLAFALALVAALVVVLVLSLHVILRHLLRVRGCLQGDPA